MSEEKERPLQANHLFLVRMSQPSSQEPSLTPNGLSAPVQGSEPSPRNYFTAEVRRRSPYNFVMAAHDPFHYLRCELALEFEENDGIQSLICQFPEICDEELSEFVEDDETLLGMALIQFQMQILQNLFVFCAAHNAGNLIIQTTEDQWSTLGIYKNFVKYADPIPMKGGAVMEVTLPVHVKACNESIDDITEQFRQTLWQDYSENQSIRNYLAANVRFSVVV
jgi:hypothetical protein